MSGRIISGMATTNSVDRSGDVVSPSGASFKVPFPLLFNHDHSKPIGTVTRLQNLGAGLLATAVLVPLGISDDADKAWGLIQAGALRGLSIGFRPLDMSQSASGITYGESEIFELSVVAVPCNADCAIVSFNSEAKAAKALPSKTESQPVKRQLLLIPPGSSAKSQAIMQAYNNQAVAHNKRHGLS